jgi:hypothetical protein
MAHSMNTARHIIRKSAGIEDRKLTKSILNVVGASALCQDGSLNAGELQRLLSDGSSRASESSRLVNKSGHYADGFIPTGQNLMKMHTGGGNEPPWYSLVRTLMRKGYLPDEIAKLLDKTRAELSKALVPGGV